MRYLGIFLLALLVCGCGQKTVSYHDNVQSVMDKKCISCHSGDHPRGKIVLTSYQALMGSRTVSGKRPLVIPGSPGESKLYILCGTTQDQFRMPPANSQVLPLTQEEVQDMGRWIMQGAREN